MKKLDVKIPWYSSYRDVKEHLEYPENTIYEFIKESANDHLYFISYNYLGEEKLTKYSLPAAYEFRDEHPKVLLEIILYKEL